MDVRKKEEFFAFFLGIASVAYMETEDIGLFRIVDSFERIAVHEAVGWTYVYETKRGPKQFVLKWKKGGEIVYPEETQLPRMGMILTILPQDLSAR